MKKVYIEPSLIVVEVKETLVIATSLGDSTITNQTPENDNPSNNFIQGAFDGWDEEE